MMSRAARLALAALIVAGTAALLWPQTSQARALARDIPRDMVVLAAASPLADLDDKLEQLEDVDLFELLDFVAGTTLFTLYHEAGHMLVSEFGLPVLGQEENAVDNLATVTMLNADTEDMDLFLTNAMIGWFLFSEESIDEMVFYGEHDLNQQRGYQILCLMVGADEEAFLDLARELDMPEERVARCALDFEQTADSWDVATEAYLRAENETGDRITVSYDDPAPGLESMALFLRESTLMEIIADELDDLYLLPDPVTFRATSCGMENAFWNAEARELTLCYELMAGHAAAYLELLAEQK